VTSKGRIGRACLEIPLVDLPAVVKALAEIAELAAKAEKVEDGVAVHS
jgi:hypothetical protein